MAEPYRGVWVSQAEVDARPTSGLAWTNVSDVANATWPPVDLNQFGGDHDTFVLAGGIVWVRTGDAAMRTKTRDGIAAAVDFVQPGSTDHMHLALNSQSYVIAADLIDLPALDPALDSSFRAWLVEIRDTPAPDGSDSQAACQARRPQNHGSRCTAARALIDVYLGDIGDLASAWTIFKGFLGDRQAYAGFSWSEDDRQTWTDYPAAPRPIERVGYTKDLPPGTPRDLDGRPPDMYRIGAFGSWGTFWPPPCSSGDGYAYGGLTGVATAAEVFYRAGYTSVFTEQTSAIARSFRFMADLGLGNPCWDSHVLGKASHNWVRWLVNYRYGTSYEVPATSTKSPNGVTFTDFTHATPLAPTERPPTANPQAVSTRIGTPVAITLRATDPDTCELGFRITRQPAHGTLGGLGEATCQPGPPQSDGATLTYSPASGFSGQDSFEFVADDGTTESGAAAVTITVADPAPTAAFTGTPRSGAAPLLVAFEDSSTDNPTSWSWDFQNDGSFESTERNPTFTYTLPGTYSVRLRATNAGGPDDEVRTGYVVVTGSTSEIAFRSASAAQSGTASTFTIATPSNVVTGDVLLATVGVRGAPKITAPTGWSLVRQDASGSNFRQAVYVRVASSAEPSTSTWTFSQAREAAGGILAFANVSTTTPVEAHSGQKNAKSTSITAPSVTTTAGAMLVGLFAVAQATSVTPPQAMTERYDVASSSASRKLTSAAASVLNPAAGATGLTVATAGVAGPNVGQLIALRQA